MYTSEKGKKQSSEIIKPYSNLWLIDSGGNYKFNFPISIGSAWINNSRGHLTRMGLSPY